MKVRLISYTPEPELLSAAAARICYSDISATEILQKFTPEKTDQLLDIVISSGHHSVLEHITFTFAIDGVSRILTHQIVRHRVGIAFSQQSQRYTSIQKAKFLTPKAVFEEPELKIKYQETIEKCLALYEELQERGIPNEDARFILPQAVTTRLLLTANLRQLMHMYSINACFRAQWEIRELMGKIKQELKRISPRLARELKIKCSTVGYCNERNMCKELKNKMPRKKGLNNEKQELGGDINNQKPNYNIKG